MRRASQSLQRRIAVLAVLPLVWLAPERFAGKVVSITDGDTISVMHDGRPSQSDSMESTVRNAGRTFRNARSNLRPIWRSGRQSTSKCEMWIDTRVWSLGCQLRERTSVWRSSAQGWRGITSNIRVIPFSPKQSVAARTERVGLWSRDGGIPPWEFRHPVALARDRAGGPFHGNQRSRVFHRPGCANFDCKNCTRIFHTSEEAVENGFRPAGDCLRAR